MGFPSGLFFVILPCPEFFFNPGKRITIFPVVCAGSHGENRQHEIIVGGEITKIEQYLGDKMMGRVCGITLFSRVLFRRARSRRVLKRKRSME
jgi:hypothetical protein